MKMKKHLRAVQHNSDVSSYKSFQSINGEHPFKDAVTDGYIQYSARTRHNGKVYLFNFDLAKEMGLISKNHPDQMNAELEKTLLDTFSLTIINDYDLLHNLKFKDVKPNQYMATRYLQLQHPNKQGKTSGDGRSIWNGCFQGPSGMWDISSNGTGATRLSPATAIENRFFKTGDPDASYGDGQGELDEAISAFLASEVFNKNGIPTERVLAVLEFPGKKAITVRAAKNLIRPAHFFHHLKQGRYHSLKNSVDYFISRQVKNKDWHKIKSNQAKYHYFCKQIAKQFGELAALFESQYIFCWMDWDGDNILATGGIIDYGSVRQFGLYHHEYRYDDVERYSTKIPEQKRKARYLVQAFIQLTDFLISKQKKNIKMFAEHPILREFDLAFENKLNTLLLEKIGLKKNHCEFLVKNHFEQVQKYKSYFSYFEKAKSKRGIYETADGLTCDAIFCMRDLLRELPKKYYASRELLTSSELIRLMKSSYAKTSDLKITPHRHKQALGLQKTYLGLLELIAKKFYKGNTNKVLLETIMRSSLLNKAERITGDGIIILTHQIIKNKNGLSINDRYLLIRSLVEHQVIHHKKIKQKPITLRKTKLKRTFKKSIQLILENRLSI